MKWLRVLLAAVAYTILAQIFHSVSTFLTMEYYLDPKFLPVWSKTMMPTAGPPPMEFLYLTIVFSFITGLLFSIVYSFIATCIPGKGATSKGVNYGLILFLISGIPFFLTNYLLINLPLMLLVYWLVIDGLLLYLAGGVAIANINK